MTVVGGYVAYVDAKRSPKFIDGNLYLNQELPYRILSIVLIIVGTLTWGLQICCFKKRMKRRNWITMPNPHFQRSDTRPLS